MPHLYDYSSWHKLTPDDSGSYINRTWTQIASLPNGYAPLYFGSVVLPDGRVVVEGGEYNCASGSCNAVNPTDIHENPSSPD